jgi:nicotinamidase-related amidase
LLTAVDLNEEDKLACDWKLSPQKIPHKRRDPGRKRLASQDLPSETLERATEKNKSHADLLPFINGCATQESAMDIDRTDSAVVFIDPQNDVLSEKGANWGAVGASVTENKTVDNMARIFEAAKANGYEIFVSPHYFYPTDSHWKFNGPVETDEFKTRTFARSGPLDLSGFPNSGADWLDRFKPYIEDGKTVVVSPHKVFGPQTNDLVLQLRKRGIRKIILGGMLANMCVESHLREFLEQGFEVAVIKDATAGPRHPEWGDGYQAAIINYKFLAHAVWSTEEVVARMH